MSQPKLFENKMGLFFEVPPKYTRIRSVVEGVRFQLLKPGTHKCVILPDHDIRIDEEWTTHGDLAGGESVKAAYNLRIRRRYGINWGIAMNNYSGHFHPDAESLDTAESEMRKVGLPIIRNVRKRAYPQE